MSAAAASPVNVPAQPIIPTEEIPAQLGPYLKIKGKFLNFFGVLYGIQSVLVLGVAWWIALTITELVCRATGWDPDRKFHDWVGKTWSRVNMIMGGCAPSTVTGRELLPPTGQAALFVSNHASWFDIPLVAQVIPNQFKFIAAFELRKLPLVGQQLMDGKHVLIDRSSRKGQLRSFKESVAYLKRGISIFAFPEGTRSRDGRLKPFKGGVFAMATKAGVPIVPLSICGTFSTYPSSAILPLLPNSKNLAVHVHPPIDSNGKTEEELEELTRSAIISKLPPESQPLP
eukprot:CAMPEP_0119311620 /NCGR_PEP_ID=MMETSP1333-20130426/23150_1 /TAXON_ID=418940 /ORGANISM="Scyphosphaera apsteinii, Strain RCC1455" /LENGTH=285 /DNA_ID=CAMNT_0007316047 /DNA_START=139 /DNA_END=996 /DNA_ORIENTATION=+